MLNKKSRQISEYLNRSFEPVRQDLRTVQFNLKKIRRRNASSNQQYRPNFSYMQNPQKRLPSIDIVQVAKLFQANQQIFRSSLAFQHPSKVTHVRHKQQVNKIMSTYIKEREFNLRKTDNLRKTNYLDNLRYMTHKMKLDKNLLPSV